jgi:hypothetical protein
MAMTGAMTPRLHQSMTVGGCKQESAQKFKQTKIFVQIFCPHFQKQWESLGHVIG